VLQRVACSHYIQCEQALSGLYRVAWPSSHQPHHNNRSRFQSSSSSCV